MALKKEIPDFDGLTAIKTVSIMFNTMNNTDLKQISKLLDDSLDKKFDQKLAPIHKTLSEHGKMLEEHGKILKQHSKALRFLKRDQSTMLAMLDGEQMKQRKRIKRIEDHFGLPSAA